MDKLKKQLPNIALAFALFVVFYYARRIYKLGQLVIDPWALLILALILIGGFLVILILRNSPRKPEFALAAFSTAIALVCGDQILKLKKMSVVQILESKIPRVGALKKNAPLTEVVFVSPAPPASRNVDEIREFYSRAGVKFEKGYKSFALLPLIDSGQIKPFLPLGGLSNALTLFCNEGDQRLFPVIRTDRYGFNNDDLAHAWGQGQILIVGDSFAQGECVHQEQTAAGVLRRSGYPTISVGAGGFGPILMLASIREYGHALKPKTVLWFYFDGNDVDDLQLKELRSDFLLQYLDPAFSQNLIARQPEIDQFWRRGSFETPYNAFNASKDLQTRWEKKLDANLPLVRKVFREPFSTLRDDATLLRVFRATLAAAKKEVEGWGGKIVFVAIPNMDDYHGRVPRYRQPALDTARDLGLEIVDIDSALKASGDPLQYFPMRSGWGHFNARGYALLTHAIIEKISGQPTSTNARAAQAVAPVAAFSPPIVMHQQYTSRGTTTNRLSADAAIAKSDQGASLLGLKFLPVNRWGTLRVSFKVNASSDNENEVVAAVFRGGVATPLRTASEPASPGHNAIAAGSFDLTLKGEDEVSFELRAGPGKPGTIALNTSKDTPPIYTTLTVWERGAIARGAIASHYDFSKDDGTKTFAKLAGVYKHGNMESDVDVKRTEVACENYSVRKDVLFVLALGESQAANLAETRLSTQKSVINFNPFDGKCYRAVDPLLGATGHQGSVWLPMADQLIDTKRYAAVVITPIAFGGTSVEDWIPPREMSRRLAFAWHRLKRAGVRVDAILWQQGEFEAGREGVTQSYYQDSFLQIRDFIRELGMKAPIYIARSTKCGNHNTSSQEAVRLALSRLSADGGDLKSGPDTDRIGSKDRFDGCHFSRAGQIASGSMWADVLTEDPPEGSRASAKR